MPSISMKPLVPSIPGPLGTRLSSAKVEGTLTTFYTRNHLGSTPVHPDALIHPSAWKEGSQKFAKDSSRIHRHLLVCRNNDAKDQSALQVDRGLRPISDDLTSGLPPSYHLDLLSDPCVIILRRPDKTVVARFTPFADPKEIRRAAEEDRARVEADPDG